MENENGERTTKIAKQIYSFDGSERGTYLCIDDDGNKVYRTWIELYPEHTYSKVEEIHTLKYKMQPIERKENGELYELNATQQKAVRRLIKKSCCNYDNGHCIHCDCDCVQYPHSTVCCKWFRWWVLPDDKALETSIFGYKQGSTRKCAMCGKTFIGIGRAKYCSDRCKKKAHYRQQSDYRRNKG